MCIDREQRESCPQVLLSCSLRPCQVIQASEVSKFPDTLREARLQLRGEKETKWSAAGFNERGEFQELVNTSQVISYFFPTN